jgi:SAM-dependent methyltransferase
MSHYAEIAIGGGDTDAPENLAKRAALILSYLPDDPCRFLDCGCGSGGYIVTLSRRHAIDAYGIEFESEKVAKAHARGLDKSRVLQGDIEDLPHTSGSFDAVLLNEVLEHVPDQHRGLDEVHRVLRPGGLLFVFSPNRRFPFETHGVISKRTGRSLPHYVPFIPWLPLSFGQRWFHYPARNYWPGELCKLVQGHDFRLVTRNWVWQTFENISGNQPRWIRRAAGPLRMMARILERVPLVRTLASSQFLLFEKS